MGEVMGSRYPTVPAVIPVYNLVFDLLEEMDFEDRTMEKTRDAILGVLREYYGKTDLSRIPRVGLSESLPICDSYQPLN